jgi:predicted O-methyltransferase YrrM
MSRSVSMQVWRNQVPRAVNVFREEGLASFLGKLFQASRIIVRSTRCRRQLRDLKRDSDIEQLVDFVCRCEEIAPIQIRSELVRMLEVLQKARLRTVVEIGTARGGSLLLFCCIAVSDASIVSIDLPGGNFGGGYSAWRVPLYRDFARESQKIHLLRADSHSDLTFENLMSILSGRPVDFLFIDGDHTYDGVRRDFELYSPLVGEGGIIGFHDIAALAPDGSYGVRRLWDELKLTYKWHEIIADPNQHGFGIGLLEK